jgi:DNA replication protein DnaC
MGELISERIRRNARELKLYGLADTADELVDRAEAGRLGYREFLDLVLESEVGVLEGRRYASRLKLSGLPHHKTLDEFDASFQPELDPKRLAELRSLRFVQNRVSSLILGPPGVGKTHLAVGLAMEALRAGYLVRYTTLDDVVRELRQADQLGTLRNKLAHYQRPHVLIVDEVGYLSPEHADANRFFQLINRRYTRSSMIVTSNKRVSEWAELFGDEVQASRSSTGCCTTPKSSRSTAPPGDYVAAATFSSSRPKTPRTARTARPIPLGDLAEAAEALTRRRLDPDQATIEPDPDFVGAGQRCDNPQHPTTMGPTSALGALVVLRRLGRCRNIGPDRAAGQTHRRPSRELVDRLLAVRAVGHRSDSRLAPRATVAASRPRVAALAAAGLDVAQPAQSRLGVRSHPAPLPTMRGIDRASVATTQGTRQRAAGLCSPSSQGRSSQLSSAQHRHFSMAITDIFDDA